MVPVPMVHVSMWTSAPRVQLYVQTTPTVSILMVLIAALVYTDTRLPDLCVKTSMNVLSVTTVTRLVKTYILLY